MAGGRYLTLFLVLTLVACGRDEPVFVSVLAPTDTPNTAGPYRVEARVMAPNGVHRLALRWKAEVEGEAFFSEWDFWPVDEHHDGGLFAMALPGRPVGTVFEHYLMLVDGKHRGGGALVTYPVGAPDELLRFTILDE